MKSVKELFIQQSQVYKHTLESSISQILEIHDVPFPEFYFV